MAYTVKRGDTLGKIARDNGLTLSQLLDLNPSYKSNPDLVRVGAQIVVEGGESEASSTSSDETKTTTVTGGHDLNGVPGTPEVWKVTDGTYRIVYFVPDTNPPVPVGYEADQTAVQAMFGPDNEIKINKEVSPDQLRKEGLVDFGSHDELANQTGDPIDALVDQIAKESDVRPWLLDDGVVEILLEATLEGRTPTAGEFAGTDWWQSHSEGERQWLLVNAEDPTTAQQRLEDNRINTRNMLISAGVWNPDERLVNFVSDRFTKGHWTQTHLNEQIGYLADPGSVQKGDSELVEFITSKQLVVDTTQEGEDRVRQLADQWLGPAFGQWSDRQVGTWARRLRDDPDGEQALVQELQKQRVTLFPEYDDPTRTYDDIAASWRNVWTQSWGQLPDETDDMFVDIVRMNDLTEAQRMLRTQGLARGNQKVIADMTQQMQSAFGTTMQRGI